MKKYILTALLIMLIIPSISFAAWWNPISWKIFKKKQRETPVSQVVNTSQTNLNLNNPELEKEKKITEKQIQDTNKELEKLKKEVVSSNKVVEKTTKNIDSSEEKKLIEEKYKKEQEEKQRQIEELTKQLAVLNTTVQKIAENTTPAQTINQNNIIQPNVSAPTLEIQGVVQEMILKGWNQAGADNTALIASVKQDGKPLSIQPDMDLTLPDGTILKNNSARYYFFKPTTPGNYTFSYVVQSLNLKKEFTIKVGTFTATPPTVNFELGSIKEGNQTGSLVFNIYDEDYQLTSIKVRAETSGDLTSSDIVNIGSPGFGICSSPTCTFTGSKMLNKNGPLNIPISFIVNTKKTGSYKIFFDINLLGSTSSQTVKLNTDTGYIQLSNS